MARASHLESVDDFTRDRYKRGKFSSWDAVQLTRLNPGSAYDTVATTSTKNASRAVNRTMGKESGLPDVYVAAVTLWNHDDSCKVEEDTHFMIPYEVLDAVATDINEWTFIPETSPLAAKRRDWCQRVDHNVDDPSNVCATALWGDGAPYSDHDSLNLLVWSCLSTILHKCRRFWIVAFSKHRLCACGCSGRCTYDSIFQVLWMYQCWLSKVYPARRHDNVLFSESKKKATSFVPKKLPPRCV